MGAWAALHARPSFLSSPNRPGLLGLLHPPREGGYAMSQEAAARSTAPSHNPPQQCRWFQPDQRLSLACAHAAGGMVSMRGRAPSPRPTVRSRMNCARESAPSARAAHSNARLSPSEYATCILHGRRGARPGGRPRRRSVSSASAILPPSLLACCAQNKRGQRLYRRWPL